MLHLVVSDTESVLLVLRKATAIFPAKKKKKNERKELKEEEKQRTRQRPINFLLLINVSISWKNILGGKIITHLRLLMGCFIIIVSCINTVFNKLSTQRGKRTV